MKQHKIILIFRVAIVASSFFFRKVYTIRTNTDGKIRVIF